MSSLFTPKSSTSNKRVLTSPEFESESKKNKLIEVRASTMESDVGCEAAESKTLTLDQHAIETICDVLKDSYRAELHELVKGSIQTLIKPIVDGVLGGLNDKIEKLMTENQELKSNNEKLASRVHQLELKADEAEQYSRRNCLRISGLKEKTNVEGSTKEHEDTDALVIDIAGNIGVNLSLSEIDRSHRVGKKSTDVNKPRPIIVKFTSFRSRNRLFKAKSQIKQTQYKGCFINEDLTRIRHNLFYAARQLLRDKRILGTWSSDGVILIKDLSGKIHRAQCPEDLAPFRDPS